MPVSAGIVRSRLARSLTFFNSAFFSLKRQQRRERLPAICFALRNEKITCLYGRGVNHRHAVAEQGVLLLPHFLPFKPHALSQYVEYIPHAWAECLHPLHERKTLKNIEIVMANHANGLCNTLVLVKGPALIYISVTLNQVRPHISDINKPSVVY